MRRLLVLMMFLACAAGSAAQVASGGEFTLQRSVVGGGGGTLSGGDYCERAADMVMRILDVISAKTWYRDLLKNSETARCAVIGAGALGDPELINDLFVLMEKEEIARPFHNLEYIAGRRHVARDRLPPDVGDKNGPELLLPPGQDRIRVRVVRDRMPRARPPQCRCRGRFRNRCQPPEPCTTAGPPAEGETSR